MRGLAYEKTALSASAFVEAAIAVALPCAIETVTPRPTPAPSRGSEKVPFTEPSAFVCALMLAAEGAGSEIVRCVAEEPWPSVTE